MHGLAAPYLTDDCQLVAIGYGWLTSTREWCFGRRRSTPGLATGASLSPVHGFGTLCQRNSAELVTLPWLLKTDLFKCDPVTFCSNDENAGGKGCAGCCWRSVTCRNMATKIRLLIYYNLITVFVSLSQLSLNRFAAVYESVWYNVDTSTCCS